MTDHDGVSSVYRDLLAARNRRDRKAFAAPFAAEGEVVGFDGSETRGRAAIGSEMTRIFADHATGEYVGKVRDVLQVSNDVALLRAAAAVIPPVRPTSTPPSTPSRGCSTRSNSGWEIVLYHNTPAQFHGRPEMVERLTAVLRRQRAQQK
jgi:uncharacterized protein (TIGR02246 family)